jgi:hypothetical protein
VRSSSCSTTAMRVADEAAAACPFPVVRMRTSVWLERDVM